jgi:cytochrome c553
LRIGGYLIKKIALVCLHVLACLIIFSCNREGDFGNKNANQKVSITYGEKAYTKLCLGCHGVEGKGGSLAKFNLTKREIINNEKSFFNIVRNGKKGTYMRGFESNRLSETSITSIQYYLKTFYSK